MLIANETDRAKTPVGNHALTLPPFFFFFTNILLCSIFLNPTMNQNILDAKICLVLNANWQSINQISVKKAFENLFSESNGRPAALAMDMETAIDENGEEVLVYANPVDWATWIKLPVRPGDLSINTARLTIRVPTVVIAPNFSKTTLRNVRFSRGAVAERDGWICGYTGKKLNRQTFTVDHINPRSRGGRDTWENIVACDKEVNQMKGDRLPHEAGLKLLKQPKAPPSLPYLVREQEIKHPSWKYFVLK
jgi:5-methylcytosine-specific restriction endonuclease McrA